MRLPLWLIAVLFLAYSAWSVNYWHCYKCHCCAGAPGPETAETSGVPLFKWKAGQPEPDDAFKKWKKALLAKAGQGDTLFIEGLYRAGEGAETGTERARALRAMMAPEMPENRVKTSARLIGDDALKEGAPPQESAAFSWLKMILKKDEGAIIESDNAVTFLFPFNSTEKDKDPKVDAYLKDLVEKHKNSAATFSIVGHTDNVGEDAENKALGLGRANAIARILRDYGIAAGRIQTDSKGESEPVADNGSDDGRHQNRRVVLTVNR